MRDNGISGGCEKKCNARAVTLRCILNSLFGMVLSAVKVHHRDDVYSELFLFACRFVLV
jgi:hypothetical protein